METSTNEKTLDLMAMLNLLKKHWLFLAVCSLIGLGLATVVTKFVMHPKYEAESHVLVNQKTNDNSGMQLSQVQTDLQMINTYKDVITNPIILNSVVSELRNTYDLPISIAKLQDMITVETSQTSQVFAVKVKADTPYLAAEVANITVKVFSQKIPTIMKSHVNNVSVISRAKMPTKPVSPILILNLAIGFILGLFFAVAVVIIKDLTNTKVTTMEYLTDELGLINLGIITEIPEKEVSRLQFQRGHARGGKA